MIDVGGIRESADLVGIVGRYVDLKRAGSEYEGLCPFHDERTPSFTVSPVKGFVHCFGCGAHHDVIGFVMRMANVSFVEACRQLGARDLAPAHAQRMALVTATRRATPVWVPVYPVPEDAPAIAPDAKCAIFNPKRGRWWYCRPSRADAYRDSRGRLMGYVLRVDTKDRGKITPQVTWCIGANGEQRWCLWPFPTRRPLCGLDELAARPDAPVLVVEGEKCRAAGAGALPHYVVVTWPGGSKGVRYVDFAPLADRDVVLWPDADEGGRQAMLGHTDYAGVLHEGVAQHAWRAGCRSLRMIDPAGQPKGWDLADALTVDGWSPRQLATWASTRVVAIDVAVEPERRCA